MKSGIQTRTIARAVAVCICAVLLAPVLICEAPSAPVAVTSSAAHDCCEQMKQQCREANMTSCCPVELSSAATAPAIARKLDSPATKDLSPAGSVPTDSDTDLNVSRVLIKRVHYSPPGPSPSSIQILRI